MGVHHFPFFFFFTIEIFFVINFFYLAVNCEFPAVGPVIAFVAQSIEEPGPPKSQD